MYIFLYIFSIFTHAEKIFIICISLQEWAIGILTQQKKSFLDYCSANMKDVTLLDSFQIMMMAHYMGRNITLIYGGGDHWSTETGMVEDIVLIYKGENEFIPTEVGT